MTVLREDKNAPFCSHCGYVLKGLTESSKCPECGRPLVEVLTRQSPAFLNAGKRYRSKATLFGWPVVDVAVGPKDGELRGHAKGIIAIGDIATGGIAIGGVARGVVAVGGVALGLFSVGGLAVGLACATGGLGAGGMASGGGAVGVLSSGGGALGVVAQGGGAIGLFTRDGRGISAGAPDVFAHLTWFFGPQRMTSGVIFQPMVATVCLTLVAGALIALIAWARLLREPTGGTP